GALGDAVEILEQVDDDLAEAEGGDGEVIAAQAGGGQAQDQASHAAGRRGQDQADPEAGLDRVRGRGDDGEGEGADGDEGGGAEVEEAGGAGDQVHPQGEEGEGQDLGQIGADLQANREDGIDGRPGDDGEDRPQPPVASETTSDAPVSRLPSPVCCHQTFSRTWTPSRPPGRKTSSRI